MGYLREQGYSICGHGYEYDLIGYLAAGNQDSYIMQVSIQVEKAA